MTARRASAAPFTRAELGVWRGFLAAHGAVTRSLSEELEREHQLSVSEFEVLLALDTVLPGGLRMSELADRVSLTPSGLSRLVDRLERRGLVERAPAETDQRANCVSLTTTGCSLYTEAAKGHRARVREIFLRRLDPAESDVLLRVWDRLLS